MTISRGTKRTAIIGVALIVGITAVIAAVVNHRSLGGTGDAIIEVERRSLRVTLRQRGEVAAAKSTNITPRTRGEIADLVEEGTIVEKDQPVAWLETTDLEQELSRARSALEIAKKRLEKALEEQRLDEELNRLAVEEAEATLRYRQKQLENAEGNLAKARRLVAANLSPRKTIEEAELRKRSEELQLENAKLALEKMTYTRKSQVEMMKAETDTARIEVEKAQSEYDEAKDILDKAVIRAPTSGMVMYEKTWVGGALEKINIGTMVGPWSPILSIPDLTTLEVVILVDEVDISRLDLGMPATITLDAFPDRLLSGEISHIAKLPKDLGQEAGWGQEKKSTGRKVFEVKLSIEGDIEGLRPGITSATEILIEEVDDALVIPIECLHKSSDQEFVYLKRRGSIRKQIVETGPANEFDVVINQGLQEGWTVLLTRSTNGGPDA